MSDINHIADILDAVKIDYSSSTKISHKSLYKSNNKLDQKKEQSRELLRQLTQKSREKILNRIRKITVESNENSHKNKCWGKSEILMIANWLKDPTDTFHEDFVLKFCPTGIHALLCSSEGDTYLVNKRNRVLDKFQCDLPGGNGLSNKRHEFILDCIVEKSSQADEDVMGERKIRIWILDLIYFKETDYTDENVMERDKWLKYHRDNIEIETDNYSISILHTISADQVNLKRIFSSPCQEFVLDGILFYHCKSKYRPGLTNLVQWLKPFMLRETFPEILTDIHQSYFDSMPKSYSSKNDFINKF